MRLIISAAFFVLCTLMVITTCLDLLTEPVSTPFVEGPVEQFLVEPEEPEPNPEILVSQVDPVAGGFTDTSAPIWGVEAPIGVSDVECQLTSQGSDWDCETMRDDLRYQDSTGASWRCAKWETVP